MNQLSKLPCRGEAGAFHVVVESPKGASIKLKYEPNFGAFVYGRPLLLGLSYPYDWGFFPSTCADDGDPLDAMIIADTATWPGVIVPSIPIGVARVVQKDPGERERKRNDRVLVVPAPAHVERRTLDALDPRVLRELQDFFVQAARSAGKEVAVEGWDGAEAAERTVIAAAERYASKNQRPEPGADPRE